MSKVTIQHYAQLLFELTHSANEKDLKPLLQEFTTFLAKEGVMSKVDAILKAYAQYWDDQNNVTTIQVMSKTAMSDDAIVSVREQFKKILNTQAVEVNNTTDDSLLGGYKVKYKDTVYDYSLVGKLSQLSTHLVKNF